MSHRSVSRSEEPPRPAVPGVSRGPGRTRLGVLAAALAVLAGCAGAPTPAALDAVPDPFQALPAPSSAAAAPTAPLTAPPIASTTKTTPSATPTPSAIPTRRAAAPARRSTAKAAPVVAAAVAPQPPVPTGPGWRPIGGDEFDAASLDTDRWNRYDGVGGFGNGRRDPDTITQSGGRLRITATGEGGGRSGGMADSMGRLHGRWEFRARTDAGRGFGSAILLWPDSENFPVDGEIDIMEVPHETRDLAHFFVHWGEANNAQGGVVPGDYTRWHTFAVEWLPDRITWFVDGVQQYETTDLERIPTKPMHLTIQLDQGPKENWIEAPDESTPAQIGLEVDWVRVYAPAS